MAGASKKGRDANAPSHQYKVGDVVLAKIKGFPAWPGVLVGNDQVPKAVLAEKPKDKFIIRFFPKADYHFPGARDLTLLTREDCRSYAEDAHRKDGELKEAYKIGASPEDWIAETDAVVRQAEKQREEDELEARENQDQLEDDEEGQASTKTQGKKRSAASKPASKPKAKKTKTDKADGNGSAAGGSKSGSAPPRKSVGAAGDDDGADGEILDEATKRVRNWRHALQRAFLPKDRLPSEEDVKDQDTTFSTVEKADITADQLKATKIGKVMRKILGLDDIPLDDVHHFRRRAEALVAKWNAVQNGQSTNEGAGEEGVPANSKSEEAAEGQQDAATEKPAASPNANGKHGKDEPNGSAEADGNAAADADVGDLTELKDDEGKSNGVDA
ncbi:unnamed protein product [Parajaminaea phylloscopi]